MFVCPCLAAAVLVYREDGSRAVATLLKRSFDFQRISAKVWLIPVLLLMPATMLVAYAGMRIFKIPVPPGEISLLSIGPLFLLFFVGALGEELGWSGYVLEPLQNRWGALRASLILGSVLAVWHMAPLQQAGRPAAWIAWWALATVALRVLHTWLFNNTGKSVFGAALFHASFNTSWQMFPDRGSHYDPKITGLHFVVIAVLVIWRWGASSLSRHSKSESTSLR
jgi:membrane protease YdiL (CAAX protease family)